MGGRRVNSCIHQKIADRLKAAGLKAGLDEELEPFEAELDNHAVHCRRHAKILQPWLAILAEGTRVLELMHCKLRSESDGFDHICTAGNVQLAAPAFLAGVACSHATGIRRLVLAGLDLPARVLLRGLIESLSMCLAVLADPLLGDEYRCADSPEKEEAVRHKMSFGKLGKRLSDLEQKAGFSEEMALDMVEWRRHNYRRYSKAVHPSMAEAFLAALPAGSPDSQATRMGALGAANRRSVETLDEANHWIMHFLYLSDPHGQGNDLLKFKRRNEYLDCALDVTTEVFRTLVLDHWTEADGWFDRMKRTQLKELGDTASPS